MSIQRDLMRQARASGLALFFNILTGLLTAITVILQAWFVSIAVQKAFLDHASLPDILPAIGWIAVLLLVRALLVAASDISARQISLRVKATLREQLLAKITRLGPIFAAGERRGELIHTAFEGIEALDAYYSQYLPQIVLAGLVPLAILIAVFPREPLSGTILLVTAPLIPLFMALIGMMTEQRTKTQWKLMTRLSTHFYDTLQGLELLKQLNRDASQADQIEETDRQYRQATMQVLRYTFLTAMALELVATLSTAMVAVEIGIRLLYGKMAYQPALFILILTPEFYLPLRQLSVRYHAAMSGLQAAVRIFEVLALPEPAYQAHTGTSPTSNVFPIRFEKVCARYPDSDQDVLSKVSFNIEKGTHTALVGLSGVGKTTLFNLLLRFLPASCGKITSAGLPVDQIPLELWLDHIAWVPQTPYIFDASLVWNITLSNRPADGERLHTAIEAAGLGDWIASLPDGLNTRTGERGTTVSAGQAQRLAIARAWYRDAELVLLDEPTSAVDPILEAELQQATARLIQGRTTLTIAHRLPTIQHSDTILLLEDGSIREAGSHTELLAVNGAYARFVERYIHAAG